MTRSALVPLLTVGIPGDTVTEILIGAFLIQGIEVGSLFIATNGPLFVQILLLLALTNLAIPWWVWERYAGCRCSCAPPQRILGR